MRILMLGASGKVGQHVVRLASTSGHQVVCLSRSEIPEKANVLVRLGDVMDPNVVSEALADCSAVISCLGLRRKVPQNPWSKVISPPNLCTQVIENLLSAKAIRVCALSAGGVHDSYASTTKLMQVLIRRSNLAVAYSDLASMEKRLSDSSIDWLCPRPVTFLDVGDSDEPANEIERYNAISTIPRRRVAAWMVAWTTGALHTASRTPLLG